MAYSYRRASRAMLVTSSTTSVAFLANVFSQLMPIRAFGIYSSIIVVINYILVVTILPPATIWYERYLEGLSTKIFYFVCCPCKKRVKK